MARFECSGIDGLELSLAEIKEIPPDVVDEILSAQAKIVVAAHKASILRNGLHKTGLLASSVKSTKKWSKGKRYILVYPAGTHHTYEGVEKTKTYAKSASGRTYTTGGGTKKATNSDVGFVHEFGAPKHGIKATQWMREANEMSAAEASAAGFVVYDNWLKSKNL